MSNINARHIAYEVLYTIIQEDGYSNITLNKYFNQHKVEEQDKRFISEVVYGSIKNKLYLEHILKSYSKGRVKPKVKVILLMSIYQLLYMDKTPSFAVIDEAVKLSKKIAGNITGKFVNGILRNIERNANNLDLKYKNATEKFCIENSCPSELYNILKEQYGVEKAQKIVVSFNEKSKNSIRYNPLKITKKELIEKLGDAVSKSEICEDSLVLNKLNLDSSLFTKGYYIVQDEASALVASSIGLPLDKKYKILDTCAAPGGKSLHIASKYFNSSLISCDKYIHKLKLVEDNKEKLGITNIDVKEQYGVEKAQKIVVSFNEKSKNSIRYNPLKITKKELIEKLGDAVSKSEICEDSLVLNKLNLDSSLFTKGYYIVQDEASALVASSIGLPLDKKYKILDTCAAPGGKSLHIASKYFNSSLISCDKYIHKLKLVEDNKEKLGITNIDVKEQDATLNNTSFNNKFDIVICDVPCSGIGVIKNKPEIKYKITNSYVEDIAKLQYDILDNSKHYVKQEGILMYSTCTIDKRENIKNIEKFLKENKDFSLESISLNNSIVKMRENGVLEILPDEYSCDGFFIAKLKKMEEKC